MKYQKLVNKTFRRRWRTEQAEGSLTETITNNLHVCLPHRKHQGLCPQCVASGPVPTMCCIRACAHNVLHLGESMYACTSNSHVREVRVGGPGDQCEVSLTSNPSISLCLLYTYKWNYMMEGYMLRVRSTLCCWELCQLEHSIVPFSSTIHLHEPQPSFLQPHTYQAIVHKPQPSIPRLCFEVRIQTETTSSCHITTK